MVNRDRGLRAVPDGEAGPGGAMAVVVCREPGHVLVALSGDVDIAAVPALRACLWPPLAGGSPVVADLDQVGFIAAAGTVAAPAGRMAADGR